MYYYLIDFSVSEHYLFSFEVVDKEELERRIELVKKTNFEFIHIGSGDYYFDLTKEKILEDLTDSAYEITEIEFISFKSMFFGCEQIGLDLWTTIEDNISTT
jgi:hypothetical protein